MNNFEITTVITAISGTIIVPIVLFFANKPRGRKKYILAKFSHNKSIIHGITIDMRKLLVETNAWNSILFKDSNTTYREYLEVLEEKYDVEYSNSQFNALKKKKLSSHEIIEYIQKLKIQEDSLNEMRINLDLVIKKMKIDN